MNWTLSEANAALFQAQALLREAKSLLTAHQRAPSADSEQAVLECLGRFEELGIQVKSIEPGLLDFPALLGNKEVLLCWKEGEEKITHYHDLSGGFAGRQPIPQIVL